MRKPVGGAITLRAGPSTAKLIKRTSGEVHTKPRNRRRQLAGKAEEGMPSTLQQKKLAEEYLKDYDIEAAGRRAGYTMSVGELQRLLHKIGPYLREAQLAKARAMGTRIATSQERVLAELAAEAHYSEYDFVVIETRKEGKKETTFRRQKYLEELTPVQQMLIKDVRFDKNGNATYSLPNRMAARTLIGKHLGMFNDKLIHEHRHSQLQQRADLSPVKDTTLEAVEKAMLKDMGPQGLRMIGEFPEGGHDEQE